MGNVVNYFEIGTPDAGATSAFYGGLFGWQIGESGDYRMIDGDKGGVWDRSAVGGGSYAIFYVQVTTCRRPSLRRLNLARRWWCH